MEFDGGSSRKCLASNGRWQERCWTKARWKIENRVLALDDKKGRKRLGIRVTLSKRTPELLIRCRMSQIDVFLGLRFRPGSVLRQVPHVFEEVSWEPSLSRGASCGLKIDCCPQLQGGRSDVHVLRGGRRVHTITSLCVFRLIGPDHLPSPPPRTSSVAPRACCALRTFTTTLYISHGIFP